MGRFLVDQWKKEHAQKRGGSRVFALETGQAEVRYSNEPVDTVTPEQLFEQNWAIAVLDTVFARLQRDYEEKGKGALFAQLKFALTGERSTLPYGQLAKQMECSESTVKSSVRRLRQRYRELLRCEVAHTVATADEVDEELEHLFRALAG
jgi:RNA polymerase sigma-70 factor (ECF subfamily)